MSKPGVGEANPLDEIEIPTAWPLPLTARALAWLAEQAEGTRNEKLALVLNQEGKVELKKASYAAERGETGFPVQTNDRVCDRFRMEKITLKVEQCQEKLVPHDWDALFWTEAAIEKFFFPYYHSQRLLTTEEIAALWQDFLKKELVAFAHVTPSRPVPEYATPNTAGVVYVDHEHHAVPTLVLQSVSDYLAGRK